MGLPSFLWSRLFSLLLAARYQPASFRFRQKSSVRAASGDCGTARISLFRRCYSLVLPAGKPAKNVQRPKDIERRDT